MALTLGMIHTAATLPYTRLAIASLRRWTPPPYRLVVLDNDGHHRADILAAGADECVTPPDGPAPFARNANLLKAYAEGDLVLLNNDLLFTPGWLEPLARWATQRPGLISPISNWELWFAVDQLSLRPTMRREEIAGYEEVIFGLARQVAARHGGQTRDWPRAMMYTCFIPAAIGQVLPFDETFVNGGEDDDLSIRAHLGGIPIYQALDSFVLHFGAKSLWDGPETPEATALRNARLMALLWAKWGPQVTAVMRDEGQDVLRAFQLDGAWASGQYAWCIQKLVAARLAAGR